jgi:hypothetical protein
VIAGGAIRDLYFGRHLKDVDIFLPKDIHGNYRDRDYVWSLMGCNIDEPFWRFDEIDEAGSDDHDYTGQFVECAWNVYRDQQTYQLMFLNVSPEEYVNRHFDIGLCKAYTDGYKIRFTRDFSNDAAYKTLTICAEDIDQPHFDYILNNHLKRMKDKFPGYTTRVAAHLVDFVNDSNRHLL